MKYIDIDDLEEETGYPEGYDVEGDLGISDEEDKEYLNDDSEFVQGDILPDTPKLYQKTGKI